MNCRIQEINTSDNIGRIIALSDIHGYAHYLDGVLEKTDYSVQDTVVIIGDMIEKGPESLKTVRRIMELRENNPKVYVVMGNVEYHRISRFYNDSPEGIAEFFEMLRWTQKVWKRSLFLDMLDELGISLDNICSENMASVKQQIYSQYAKELDFLWNLPTVLAIGKYIFVHGGIPTDCLQELENTAALTYMKMDAFLKTDVSFHRTVVVGHWPVYHYREDEDCLNPLFDYQKNIVAIDGGCALKHGNQLNALIIPRPDADIRELEYISYDDYPVITAPKSQKAKEWSVRLRYFDCEVEILEDHGDVVTLRHIRSGKTFVVPKTYLYFSQGKVCCSDCSDAYLAIEQGDTLSVIAETSVGSIVKKNGVIGWYRV